MTTIGMLIFDGAEELDFVGPWEVFSTTAEEREELRVVALSPQRGPVRCAKGLQVVPDAPLAEAPELDVVLVPGGRGTRREVGNPVVIEWLRGVEPSLAWITSVCTGALLLCEAGFANGRPVTTHWAFVDELRRRYPEVRVRDDVRYVRDGRLCTAAGVSAGIDMALWLVGQLFDPETARRTQRAMQYEPAPPYAAAT